MASCCPPRHTPTHAEILQVWPFLWSWTKKAEWTHSPSRPATAGPGTAPHTDPDSCGRRVVTHEEDTLGLPALRPPHLGSENGDRYCYAPACQAGFKRGIHRAPGTRLRLLGCGFVCRWWWGLLLWQLHLQELSLLKLCGQVSLSTPGSLHNPGPVCPQIMLCLTPGV